MQIIVGEWDDSQKVIDSNLPEAEKKLLYQSLVQSFREVFLPVAQKLYQKSYPVAGAAFGRVCIAFFGEGHAGNI